jgi:hypothetical protein
MKGVTGYVILNDTECRNRVVITNARATSISTCDRIASQNSRKISRPYSKKMSWLHDQQEYCLRCVPLRSPLIQKGWNWRVIFYWNWTFEGMTHINIHIYQGGKEPATNQSSHSRWEYYIVESNGRQGNLWIDAPRRCNMWSNFS